MSTRDGDTGAERFIAALLERHAAPLRRSEFLKAIRALSARYVERRATLADRSPLDSAGKRAAFAAYYAPLHYLTVGHILDALGSRALDRVVDLGCGTGVAGAAWAVKCPSATLLGVDRSGWAVEEAAWTYRTLGLSGRATRGDLVRATESLAGPKPGPAYVRQPGPAYERQGRPAYLRATGVILAWSSNELEAPARSRLLSTLVELGRSGASILIVEPISRRAAPWFDDWAAVITKAGGRQDDWRFDEPRPPSLSRIDIEVGFDRAELTARSLAINLP